MGKRTVKTSVADADGPCQQQLHLILEVRAEKPQELEKPKEPEEPKEPKQPVKPILFQKRKVYSQDDRDEWDKKEKPIIITVQAQGVSLKANVWKTDTMDHVKRFVINSLLEQGIFLKAKDMKITDLMGSHLPNYTKARDSVDEGDTVLLVLANQAHIEV